MGIKYLWDTNISIYFLEKLLPEKALAFIISTLKAGKPTISAITEIELLSWKFASDKDILILRDFISDAIVIDLEQEIKERAAQIRRKSGLKLPDAVIAATAIVYDITLISRNEKDFNKVEELQFINPYQL